MDELEALRSQLTLDLAAEPVETADISFVESDLENDDGIRVGSVVTYEVGPWLGYPYWRLDVVSEFHGTSSFYFSTLHKAVYYTRLFTSKRFSKPKKIENVLVPVSASYRPPCGFYF